MVVLRATQKVLKSLPRSANDNDVSDTALGDWYVNRIVVDRQPLLLFVSSKSLLAMLAPARNVKRMPEQFPIMVADRLRRLGVDRNLVDSEVNAMKIVRVGRTQDRSVTGTMVDFAKALPYYLPEAAWDARDLRLAEDRFAETPCRCTRSDTIWPYRDTVKLLDGRWRSPVVLH